MCRTDERLPNMRAPGIIPFVEAAPHGSEALSIVKEAICQRLE
jgi:hypothetical protein